MVDPASLCIRYMKKAGMFDAPPNVVEDVQEICLKGYAHKLLVLVEQRIEDLQIRKHIRKKKEQAREVLYQIEEEIENLEPGEKKRLPYQPDKNRFLYVRRTEPNDWGTTYYEYGYGKNESYPYEVIHSDKDELIEKLRMKLYEEHDRLLSEKGDLDSDYRWRKDRIDRELVESHEIRKDLEKYVDKPRDIRHAYERKVWIDLEGWPYVEDTKEAEETLRDMDYHKFTTFLHFDSYEGEMPEGAAGVGGYWDEEEKELHLYPSSMPDLDDVGRMFDFDRWQEIKEDILKDVRHECQHVGQTVLNIIKDIDEAGEPADESFEDKGPVDPSKMFGGGFADPENLKDVEFYTKLKDEVERFVERMRERRPKPKWGDYLKVFVGQKSPEELERANEYSASKFFQDLKKEKPDHYKKAVKEFTKEVQKRLDI